MWVLTRSIMLSMLTCKKLCVLCDTPFYRVQPLWLNFTSWHQAKCSWNALMLVSLGSAKQIWVTHMLFAQQHREGSLPRDRSGRQLQQVSIQTVKVIGMTVNSSTRQLSIISRAWALSLTWIGSFSVSANQESQFVNWQALILFIQHLLRNINLS